MRTALSQARRLRGVRQLHGWAGVLGAVAVLAVATPVTAELVGPLPPDQHQEVRAVAQALSTCPTRLSLTQRWSIARSILQQSAEHGFDPLLITALVQVESGCSPTARGGGAVGLTQLLPSTARAVARRAGVPWRGEATLKDPHDNLRIGVQYLHELTEMLDCPFRAMAAYNMGPRPVLRMSSQRAQRVRYVRKVVDRYERLRGDARVASERKRAPERSARRR